MNNPVRDTIPGPTPAWARNERSSNFHGKWQWTYLSTFLSGSAVLDLAKIQAAGWEVTIRGLGESVHIRINERSKR